MSAVVLTSENSAAYYAKKLDLEPEPAKVADPVKTEGDQAIESAKPVSANDAEKEAAEQQEADHPDPEKKQKLNLRFSELSKQRDEAKALAEKNAAEAKTAREALELAERQAAELKAKYEPPKSDELGPKPARAQFSTDADFELALEDWAGDKAVRERDAIAAEKQRVDAFVERVRAVKAETPDYDAIINASNVVVSDEIKAAILDSEVGPQVLLHFAKNPDVAARIKSLKIDAAMREFGKLEAKLMGEKPATKSEPAESKPVAAATEVSRAPAPISPLKSSGSPVASASVDSNGEFHGSYADWKAQRKAGKIK